MGVQSLRLYLSIQKNLSPKINSEITLFVFLKKSYLMYYDLQGRILEKTYFGQKPVRKFPKLQRSEWLTFCSSLLIADKLFLGFKNRSSCRCKLKIWLWILQIFVAFYTKISTRGNIEQFIVFFITQECETWAFAWNFASIFLFF